VKRGDGSRGVRRLARASASGIALVTGVLAAGCSEPTGEVILVITTDMAIPKDIDAVEVEILVAGEVHFYSEYAERHGGLKLPGTLTIADDTPGRPFTARVIGLQEGRPRVLREITTSVPEGRTAMLRAPLRWICDGSAVPGPDGRVETPQCSSGDACFPGACAPSKVDAASLPSFSLADVFGGGTGAGSDGACFDTVACFDGIAPVLHPFIDADCTVSAEGATNVALLTEGEGICGGTGCFIPLDYGDPSGFTEAGGLGSRRVQLPSFACERQDKVFGVVLSPRCAPKPAELPACGPWSLAGGGVAPDPTIPVVFAARQHHPSSLVLHGERAFWTNAGGEGSADGAVKSSRRIGGTPVVIRGDQAFPSALIADSASLDGLYLYWINEAASSVSSARSDGGDPRVYGLTGGARHGLASSQKQLFWSTTDGKIRSLAIGKDGAFTDVAAGQDDPSRIAADVGGVYWTNRGEGTIRRAIDEGSSKEGQKLAQGLAQPGALALSQTHIYWLNQGTLDPGDPEEGYKGGGVMRVARTGDSPVVNGDEPELIAGSGALPYALAIDEKSVYFTTLLDGVVLRVPLAGDGPPVPLAVGQKSPVAIAVDDEHVYWANAGTWENDYRDGAIMKVKK
jgi:hypothetical protein